MLVVTNPEGYTLSDDPARVDVDLVYRWLSTDAYWALGRSRDVIGRAVAGSGVYGVYHPDGRQVAFARVVTDSATFAWLCDVYVDRAERGHGLGTWMVGVIRDTLAAQGLFRILLATADAHGVYAKLGFAPLARPDRWMEHRPAG